MAHVHPIYGCPHCKTRIPFGTETKRASSRCPGCKHLLFIQSTMESVRTLPTSESDVCGLQTPIHCEPIHVEHVKVS